MKMIVPFELTRPFDSEAGYGDALTLTLTLTFTCFWLTSGNHEYYTGDVDNWMKHLQDLGFDVLHNSNVKLPSTSEHGHICVAGIDDIEADRIGYCTGRFPLLLLLTEVRHNVTVSADFSFCLGCQRAAVIPIHRCMFSSRVFLSGPFSGCPLFLLTALTAL